MKINILRTPLPSAISVIYSLCHFWKLQMAVEIENIRVKSNNYMPSYMIVPLKKENEYFYIIS